MIHFKNKVVLSACNYKIYQRRETAISESINRITIFAGHNGSGKTQLTINRALYWKQRLDSPVVSCDMDTVKPYFRGKDAEGLLTQAGVRFIAPEFANSNVDLPTVPPEIRLIFDQPDVRAFLDVGGDTEGAVALGQFSRNLRDIGYDMLLVVNQRRYLTREPDEVLELMRDIESVASLSFTGIVNNTNLGDETTAGVILQSLPFIRELSARSGLPVVATACREDITLPEGSWDGQLWPVRVFRKSEWAIYDDQ